MAELGEGWRAKFKEFSDAPFAAASIGQVRALVESRLHPLAAPWLSHARLHPRHLLLVAAFCALGRSEPTLARLPLLALPLTPPASKSAGPQPLTGLPCGPPRYRSGRAIPRPSACPLPAFCELGGWAGAVVGPLGWGWFSAPFPPALSRGNRVVARRVSHYVLLSFATHIPPFLFRAGGASGWRHAPPSAPSSSGTCPFVHTHQYPTYVSVVCCCVGAPGRAVGRAHRSGEGAVPRRGHLD